MTGKVRASITDGSGRRTASGEMGGGIPGAVLLPLGTGPAGWVGLVTDPVSSSYVLEVTANDATAAGLSATFPPGDGPYAHLEVALPSLPAGGKARLTVYPA